MSSQRQPQSRAARPIPDPLDPQETIALERSWFPRAGVLAILGGLLPIVASVLQILATRDLPTDAASVQSVADAVTRYAAGESGLHGFQAQRTVALGDKAGLVITSAILSGLGAVLAAPVLLGLLRAAYRRRPSFPRWFLWLPLVGGVLFGVGSAVALTYGAVNMSDFASLPAAQQTNAAATDALQSAGDDLGPLLIVSSLAQMLFAVGLGAAALSAMNVGLLTRAMGIIGVLLAVLVVIPIVDQQGFLRSFWLIFLGVLLLGRWRGGRPEAWEAGLPRPWPTRAEQLEAAERARAAKQNATTPASDDDAPAPTPKSGNRSKKRRK